MRKLGLIIAVIAVFFLSPASKAAETPSSVRELTVRKTEAVFFFKKAGDLSERVLENLVRLREKYAEFSFLKLDIDDSEAILFYRDLNKGPLEPAVVIGDVFLAGEDSLSSREIERYVRKYRFEEIVSGYSRFLKNKAKTMQGKAKNDPVFIRVLPVVYRVSAGVLFVLACFALIDFIGYSRGVEYRILLSVPVRQKHKILLFFCFVGLGTVFIFLS
ncbi:MAG: hypothetical protein ABH844_06640 [Candidatus Omnitrophota bacterium]